MERVSSATEAHEKIPNTLRAAEHLPYDGEAVGVTVDERGALAGAWLRPPAGERVALLAEQHVPAKRYPVATDPSYERGLSDASRRTLERRGGPMSPEELAEFEGKAGWRDAAELRRRDDLAGDPDARVPPPEEYEGDLWSVVSEHYGAGLSGQNRIDSGVGEAQ